LREEFLRDGRKRGIEGRGIIEEVLKLIKNCKNCIFWDQLTRNVIYGECKLYNNLTKNEVKYQGDCCSGWIEKGSLPPICEIELIDNLW